MQVWRALCIPYNEEVAVKLLDLENVNCSLVSTSLKVVGLLMGRQALDIVDVWVLEHSDVLLQ